MIRSGSSFIYKGKNCIVGAVIRLKGQPYIVTASHLFPGAGEHVTAEGMEVVVRSVFREFDLALIELPSGCEVEFTDIGKAEVLEDAWLVNCRHTLRCRVVSAGATLVYVSFPCARMPESGDSGSPILQAGKVIGLISSVLLSNCMGVAISSDVLRNMG